MPEFDTENFQTPEWCCKYMASLVPKKCKRILEPTPGKGNLVRALDRKGFSVTAPEDFFRFDLDTPKKKKKFDCVVMNPPFSPMRTGYHILYKCMDMSKRIIALMPWLVLINSAKRTRDIFEFGLISVTHLPRKTFPGARVQTCILKMKKGWTKQTRLKYLERD